MAHTRRFPALFAVPSLFRTAVKNLEWCWASVAGWERQWRRAVPHAHARSLAHEHIARHHDVWSEQAYQRNAASHGLPSLEHRRSRRRAALRWPVRRLVRQPPMTQQSCANLHSACSSARGCAPRCDKTAWPTTHGMRPARAPGAPHLASLRTTAPRCGSRRGARTNALPDATRTTCWRSRYCIQQSLGAQLPSECRYVPWWRARAPWFRACMCQGAG